jgi:hypothetical protein
MTGHGWSTKLTPITKATKSFAIVVIVVAVVHELASGPHFCLPHGIH